MRASELTIGYEHEAVLMENLTRTHFAMYAGASGDYNPAHTDEGYAIDVMGLPSVFGHGMLTMGLTATMLTDFLGHGSLLTYGARFVKQVWPGDTLSSRAVVAELEAEADGRWFLRLDITTNNQKGEAVLTASATARLDS